MNSKSQSLIQRWYVRTDEHGAELLVARWVSDAGRSDATEIV
jgi:hypothetical protein